MWQNATKRFFLNTITLIVAIICAILVFVPTDRSNAQKSKYAKLAEYLVHLRDDNFQFYIGFKTPIAGEVGWDVPEDIVKDDEIIGGRDIKEIGDDYVCIEEWGVGLSFISCVPFDNISFIGHRPAPQPK
jgi:hypothetical protein